MSKKKREPNATSETVTTDLGAPNPPDKPGPVAPQPPPPSEKPAPVSPEPPPPSEKPAPVAPERPTSAKTQTSPQRIVESEEPVAGRATTPIPAPPIRGPRGPSPGQGGDTGRLAVVGTVCGIVVAVATTAGFCGVERKFVQDNFDTVKTDQTKIREDVATLKANDIARKEQLEKQERTLERLQLQVIKAGIDMPEHGPDGGLSEAEHNAIEKCCKRLDKIRGPIGPDGGLDARYDPAAGATGAAEARMMAESIDAATRLCHWRLDRGLDKEHIFFAVAQALGVSGTAVPTECVVDPGLGPPLTPPSWTRCAMLALGRWQNFTPPCGLGEISRVTLGAVLRGALLGRRSW